MDRPRPVPSPAGLVVKKGLNIFSLTSGEMPVPLSRILISTRSPRFFVAASKRRLIAIAIVLLFALGRRIKAVGDQVQESPCDLLREDIDFAGGRIKGPLHSDLEALLLGAGTMIGEIEALLDERVDIDQPMFARSFARMQQHVLDDGVGALAVLNDLVEIVAQGVRQFG